MLLVDGLERVFLVWSDGSETRQDARVNHGRMVDVDVSARNTAIGTLLSLQQLHTNIRHPCRLYRWGFGDGSPTISEMGIHFSCQEMIVYAYACMHTHSAAARKEGENMGWGSPSSLGGGLDAHCQYLTSVQSNLARKAAFQLYHQLHICTVIPSCPVFMRDSIYAIARICIGNSVRLSVCHTGGSVKSV